MNYQKFRERILEELHDFYGSDATIVVKEIAKNNDVYCEGILIQKTSEDSHMCPIFYLDDLYEDYCNGRKTMEDCVGTAIEMREENKLNENVEAFAESILCWEEVKEFIYPALVSAAANEKALSDLVSASFLDLAVIYMIRKEVMPFECSSVKITKPLMEQYRITLGELHMQAMENMKKDGYVFRNMKDIFADFLPVELEKTEEEPFIAGELYVLTNKQKRWGAAGLLYQDWLKEQLGNISCYIMPSSIHETIFVPIVEGMDAKVLSQMVVDVNRSYVEVQERLSDHCYLYNGRTQTICSCE